MINGILPIKKNCKKKRLPKRKAALILLRIKLKNITPVIFYFNLVF